MSIEEIFRMSGLSVVHFILAYMGMAIHVLIKLQELNQTAGFTIGEYAKKNIYSIIASVISIPVILLLSTDTALKEWFHINYATAVLAGWQTQSLFKSLMTLTGKKIKPTNDDKEEPEN